MLKHFRALLTLFVFCFNTKPKDKAKIASFKLKGHFLIRSRKGRKIKAANWLTQLAYDIQSR